MRNYEIPFLNREQAAEFLAHELMRYKNQKPLLIGIPRGAVPMTQKIAGLMHADWNVVLVHKIPSPLNPEYAIGAVSEEGGIYVTPMDQPIEAGLHFNEMIRQGAATELKKLKQRRSLIDPYQSQPSFRDRTVIVIDDGIATGATLIAAIRSIKKQFPARIIVATPVASQSAVELLRHEGVEIVILKVPRSFYSVSQFYEEFPQVSDEEFISIVKESGKKVA